MANTMQFDLVAPEKRLASLQASEVRIPGAEGDLTAMPDHAPLITTLRPGLLEAVGPEGTSAFVVSGGFAEITPQSTSVLAEKAVSVEEVTGAFMESLIGEATSAADSAPDDQRDAANKLVADLQALRSVLGV